MEKLEPSARDYEAAEKLIKQMQEHTGSEARDVVDKLKIDGAHCASVFREMVNESSDRAVAITIYALFDDMLLEVFESNLSADTPGGTASILNPSGFLGTSHNRVKLAVGLGWLSKETYSNVNILRNVRNRFAHHISIRTFNDEPVSGYVSSLAEHHWFDEPLKSKSKRHQYLFRSAGIFTQFVLEIVVRPYALKFRVDPRFILGKGKGEWPSNLYRFLGAMQEFSKMMIQVFH
jgi:DNA-binding MltR family transcriptional regulator